MALHLRDHQKYEENTPTRWEAALSAAGLTLATVKDESFPQDRAEIQCLSEDDQCIILHPRECKARWIKAFESRRNRWMGTLVLVTTTPGGVAAIDAARILNNPEGIHIQALPNWPVGTFATTPNTNRAKGEVIRFLREKSGT